MESGFFSERYKAAVREAWTAVQTATREGRLHRVLAPPVQPAGSGRCLTRLRASGLLARLLDAPPYRVA